ncbi:SA1362 family protein [Lentibacillus sediminis]|uniref:SA1362 family protein n=1 Tax=Lentibacillus sediminis TaxID=1940529 RepID=UPI000C1BA469|nr:SA1362 family protein [Lentibacillus sediminis]
MGRNKMATFVCIVAGLALIGIVSQLFTAPVSFLSNIFVMLGIGLAIFALFYFVFLRKKTASNDMKKYKKAVRQSKAKYNDSRSAKPSTKNANKRKSPQPVRKKTAKRAAHLKVIDGNKSKKRPG